MRSGPRSTAWKPRDASNRIIPASILTVLAGTTCAALLHGEQRGPPLVVEPVRALVRICRRKKGAIRHCAEARLHAINECVGLGYPRECNRRVPAGDDGHFFLGQGPDRVALVNVGSVHCGTPVSWFRPPRLRAGEVGPRPRWTGLSRFQAGRAVK